METGARLHSCVQYGDALRPTAAAPVFHMGDSGIILQSSHYLSLSSPLSSGQKHQPLNSYIIYIYHLCIK